MQEITFKKASCEHQDTIFKWLNEPHVTEFWDNSQEHKNDIINFMQGRKTPSEYANGHYVYWIGFINKIPFSFMMTFKETILEKRPPLKNQYMSSTGTTYSIDFMIGNKDYLSQGLGHKTLTEFTHFFQDHIDRCADTFFIDPDLTNPRAKHVYEKAGFEYIGTFTMQEGFFTGQESQFLVKRLPSKLQLIKATLDDYPVIQNMARFYVYDLSRSCLWPIEKDGVFEAFDFKCYFTDTDRQAFLLRVQDELAGFVLINQACVYQDSHWNIGEFFILAKFQNQGIGQSVAHILWQQQPGKWEIAVIPNNRQALSFWEKTIHNFNGNGYQKNLINIDYDHEQPTRWLFTLTV